MSRNPGEIFMDAESEEEEEDDSGSEFEFSEAQMSEETDTTDSDESVELFCDFLPQSTSRGRNLRNTNRYLAELLGLWVTLCVKLLGTNRVNESCPFDRAAKG